MNLSKYIGKRVTIIKDDNTIKGILGEVTDKDGNHLRYLTQGIEFFRSDVKLVEEDVNIIMIILK